MFRFTVLSLAMVPAALASQGRPDSSLLSLPAVSVTATRSEFSSRAQPISVTVFDRATLRASGIKQISDVLRLVPGATVLQSGSFGAQSSLFFRGGESDYVQVLVDGVPLNAAGGAFDFGQLTIDNVERVEVSRGPGSVLYGSDAVSGVIQIFTRTGARATQFTGRVGRGTYDTWDYALGAVGGKPSAAWSIDASRNLTDGSQPFNSAFRNDVLSSALNLRGQRADAKLSVRHTEFTQHYPTNSSGALVDSNAFNQEERTVYSGDVGLHFGAGFQIRGRLAGWRAEPRTRDLPNFEGDANSYVADARDTRRIGELRGIAKLGQHELTVAYERVNDRERASSHSTSDFGPFDDSSKVSRSNGGLSLQLVGNAGRRTSYTTGLRFDDNSEFGKFTTFRAGGAYVLSRGVSVRASGGTAFKAPSFFENFATGFVIGNPNLKPERTTSFEAGMMYAHQNQKFSLGATLFTQRFRDLIQYVAAAPQGEPNYENLARASADGAEFELGVRLAPGMIARGSYTLLRTKVTDAGADEGTSATFVNGERLLRRPSQLAAVSVRESVGQGTADITLTYTGSRDDRDFSSFPATPVKMKSFMRVDISVERPLDSFGPLHNPALIARVRNATNANYQEVFGFQTPGRTYFLGLRIGD